MKEIFFKRVAESTGIFPYTSEEIFSGKIFIKNSLAKGMSFYPIQVRGFFRSLIFTKNTKEEIKHDKRKTIANH